MQFRQYSHPISRIYFWHWLLIRTYLNKLFSTFRIRPSFNPFIRPHTTHLHSQYLISDDDNGNQYVFFLWQDANFPNLEESTQSLCNLLVALGLWNRVSVNHKVEVWKFVTFSFPLCLRIMWQAWFLEWES